MNISQNQRGVSIIAVVATMLILSVMGVVLVTMVTTGSDISVNQLRSEQALYIAQGGIEYGLYTTTRGGGSWGEFNFPPKTLGNGSFTLTTNTSINNGRRRMTLDSTGTVTGLVVAQRRVMVFANRTSGGYGSTILNEPFPAGSVPADTLPGNSCASSPALSWCYSYITNNNPGGGTNTSQYDGTQNAPGSTGGSLLAQTSNGNSNRLTGYRQRTLSTPLSAGTQVILNLNFQKTNIGGPPQGMVMAVDLVAMDNTAYRVWSDTGTVSVGFGPSGTAPFTVPASKTINRILLSFDLWNKATGGKQLSVWFDDVSLNTGSGTIPVSVVNWQEIYQ